CFCGAMHYSPMVPLIYVPFAPGAALDRAPRC
ncbi:MAG: hypothetical protein ACI8XO_005063, partial [Verrucomicrobiales bacterium]